MKSTIFKNFNEVTEQKDILKILSDIKTGVYQNAITYLRKSLADNKKEAAEKAKKSLPAFTPSATFNGGRKMEFLTNYNALMVLDIDKLEKEKLQQCKTKIRMDDFVFASFVSPSGNGLKIFVKVSSDKEQHKETFLELQRYFEELLQVEIDKSGKDITRLCFMSFDPELYLNENAEVFASGAKQSVQTDSQTVKKTDNRQPTTRKPFTNTASASPKRKSNSQKATAITSFMRWPIISTVKVSQKQWL